MMFKTRQKMKKENVVFFFLTKKERMMFKNILPTSCV